MIDKIYRLNVEKMVSKLTKKNKAIGLTSGLYFKTIVAIEWVGDSIL